MNDANTIRRELAEIEAELAERQARNKAYLAKSLAPLEGKRDRLISELADTEGAAASRPVAVR